MMSCCYIFKFSAHFLVRARGLPIPGEGQGSSATSRGVGQKHGEHLGCSCMVHNGWEAHLTDKLWLWRKT